MPLKKGHLYQTTTMLTSFLNDKEEALIQFNSIFLFLGMFKDKHNRYLKVLLKNKIHYIYLIDNGMEDIFFDIIEIET